LPGPWDPPAHHEPHLGVWIKGLGGALLPRPTLKAASPDSECY
jgi:hypothetical protein